MRGQETLDRAKARGPVVAGTTTGDGARARELGGVMVRARAGVRAGVGRVSGSDSGLVRVHLVVMVMVVAAEVEAEAEAEMAVAVAAAEDMDSVVDTVGVPEVDLAASAETGTHTVDRVTIGRGVQTVTTDAYKSACRGYVTAT